MLVLIIMSVVTIDVHAVNYVADDSYIMSSQYHDIFNNYFSDDVSYQYFSYECNYGSNTRHCYYGINSKNEYLNVIYENTGYNSYTTKIVKGIDENFSVSGVNVYKKNVNPTYSILYGIAFIFVLFIIWKLVDKYV